MTDKHRMLLKSFVEYQSLRPILEHHNYDTIFFFVNINNNSNFVQLLYSEASGFKLLVLFITTFNVEHVLMFWGFMTMIWENIRQRLRTWKYTSKCIVVHWKRVSYPKPPTEIEPGSCCTTVKDFTNWAMISVLQKYVWTLFIIVFWTNKKYILNS